MSYFFFQCSSKALDPELDPDLDPGVGSGAGSRSRIGIRIVVNCWIQIRIRFGFSTDPEASG
jgi:hypothetical protein